MNKHIDQRLFKMIARPEGLNASPSASRPLAVNANTHIVYFKQIRICMHVNVVLGEELDRLLASVLLLLYCVTNYVCMS